MAQVETSHRCSYLVILAVILAAALLTVAVLMPLALLLLRALGGTPALWTMWYSVPGAAVFALVCAWAITRGFVVRVSPAGISGHDASGRRRFVTWDSISRTSRFSLVGLKYVRVFADEAESPLWIPLFLTSPRAFATAVSGAAPVGNPFREAVEECLTSASS